MAGRGRLPNRAERWLAWSRTVEPSGYTAKFDLQGVSEVIARQIKNGGDSNWIVVTPRYLGVGAGVPTTTAHRLLSHLTQAGLLALRELGSGTAPSKWTTGRLPRDGASEAIPDFEPLWATTYGIGYRARSVFRTLAVASNPDYIGSALGISRKVCLAELSRLSQEGLVERTGEHWRPTGTAVTEARSWRPAQQAFADARSMQELERKAARDSGWAAPLEPRHPRRPGGA